MRAPEADPAYYQRRAAVEFELALGAAHPKAAEAHHALALRYLDLTEQLAIGRRAEPEAAEPA